MWLWLHAFCREPAVLRGVSVGPCTLLWDKDYLCTRGGKRDVKVHVSQDRHMDFISKNFLYRTLPFCELVQRASGSKKANFFISETELYYLRTLGSDSRKEPANIATQFPELAEDVTLPKLFPNEAFFSSVLRIASPQLCLWTHYDTDIQHDNRCGVLLCGVMYPAPAPKCDGGKMSDCCLSDWSGAPQLLATEGHGLTVGIIQIVMDNFLIQVKGKKKAVLFHPNDFEYLYIQGDKSRVLDVECPDLEKFPKFQKATRYEATLNSGDILFIPALWFHNMTALDFGIAVNVFWRNLDASLYDKNDPYGNKDLIPAAKALASVQRATKELQLLPFDCQQFYALKMISQIKETFNLS
ncbi:tRNA wybutosine-synthesizing protein 5-like isoform X2 [Dermacentor andersoni]|uniref:tRNA wybutosine-synthesizing protein 5-like isoform X2 n=1 Tax=Dermacentor andersoni TaxID=34620 RepID=UPI00241716CD|nr:tRNA wybutosine-synthesizing protein 5-like isoform X2 [Dermacentor andersoni]